MADTDGQPGRRRGDGRGHAPGHHGGDQRHRHRRPGSLGPEGQLQPRPLVERHGLGGGAVDRVRRDRRHGSRVAWACRRRRRRGHRARTRQARMVAAEIISAQSTVFWGVHSKVTASVPSWT